RDTACQVMSARPRSTHPRRRPYCSDTSGGWRRLQAPAERGSTGSNDPPPIDLTARHVSAASEVSSAGGLAAGGGLPRAREARVVPTLMLAPRPAVLAGLAWLPPRR